MDEYVMLYMDMKTTAQIKRQQGFTLIELLVVIGILAILLAITFVAINPQRLFGQANNTKRRNDAVQILNAIGQYASDHQGQLPGELATMAATGSATLDSTNFPLLCSAVLPTYTNALPMNPSIPNAADITNCAATPWATGYSLSKDVNNRVTVTADTTDLSVTISVSR